MRKEEKRGEVQIGSELKRGLGGDLMKG